MGWLVGKVDGRMGEEEKGRGVEIGVCMREGEGICGERGGEHRF